MSASDAQAGPSSKRGPRLPARTLKSGKDAQHDQWKTLANRGETHILSHPGCRLALFLQSAYSADVFISRTHNLDGHAAKLKQLFTDICADEAGRVPAAVLCTELRSQLAGLADEVVIAKIAEVLVELWLVSEIVSKKQATMMINCVAGVDLNNDDGECRRAGGLGSSGPPRQAGRLSGWPEFKAD